MTMQSLIQRPSRHSALELPSPLLIMVVVLTASSLMIPLSPNQGIQANAASPGDPSVTLVYLYNATDVGGLPIFISYTPIGFTPPLTQTWSVNGANAGSGENYTLQTTQAGNFTITVHVTDQAGDSATSAPVTFRINQPPTATKLQVMYTPGASTATATLLFSGGTAPFSFNWLLNGKNTLTLGGKAESCAGSASCTFDLPSTGVNNVSVTVTDSQGVSTAAQTAQITYQQSAGGSLGIITYAAIGGGVGAALVIVFLFRKRIFMRKGTVAVETGEKPAKKPPSPMPEGKPAATLKTGQDSGTKAVPNQTQTKPASRVPIQQPVIKIVREVTAPASASTPQQVSKAEPPTRVQSTTPPTPQSIQEERPKPSEPKSAPVTAANVQTGQAKSTEQLNEAASKTVSQPSSVVQTDKSTAEKLEHGAVGKPRAAVVISKEASVSPAPQSQVATPESVSVSMLRRDLNQDPSDWILDCVGGYGFWSLEKGPLPKSELEKEFKKRYPNITIANFNSLVYDLIYKDKISSESVNGSMVLKLTKSVSEEKSAEWNRRLAEAKLLEAQLEARKQGAQPMERRKEWIELKPQAALGDGGPFDDLNARMRESGWYGRILTTGVKEVKSIMWHREPPVNESAPPKKYYPNIMIEWRQSGLGKGAAWHVEGVNISEDEFRERIESKTWSEWLSKNKISVDFQTWEEAVVKVLEMGSTFVR